VIISSRWGLDTVDLVNDGWIDGWLGSLIQNLYYCAGVAFFLFDLFVLLPEFLFSVIIVVGFFPSTCFFHKKS